MMKMMPLSAFFWVSGALTKHVYRCVRKSCQLQNITLISKNIQ